MSSVVHAFRKPLSDAVMSSAVVGSDITVGAWNCLGLAKIIKATDIPTTPDFPALVIILI
jgi:hypothetical protein